MVRSSRVLFLAALVMVAAAACGPAPALSPSAAPGETQAGPAATTPQRTLVIINRAEIPSIAAKPIVGFSGSLDHPVDMFNATLDQRDERGNPQPELAEGVPRLNTDTWQVRPDGRMETRYTLRPNLTWHDGTSLSAEDFAFGWRVYATPELGVSKSPPIGEMEEVLAPDPRTVNIRWRRPYADAMNMDAGFQSLPRHILQEPFAQLAAPEFANHPFWSYEYVGLGPYRVDRWEPGVAIEAVAFDGYVHGKPKIERVRIIFIGDPNTALANMLAGDAHYLGPFVFGAPEGDALQVQWGDRGVVLYAPVQIRLTQIQQRPDVANPRELVDLRVRRALAHAFDAPGVVEALTAGKGILTYSLTHPQADFYSTIDPVITKYPYDPLRAQQLLEEAGFTRGPDGFYRTPAGEPFAFERWHTASGKNERENAVYMDSLRRAGIDATGRGMARELLADTKTRALTPALFGGSVGYTRRFAEYTTAAIPSAENRWQGLNRLGWANREYDRFYAAFSKALDQSERVQLIAEMERVWTADVASLAHFFDPVVIAHVAELTGPVPQVTPDGSAGTLSIHRWEWAR